MTAPLTDGRPVTLLLRRGRLPDWAGASGPASDAAGIGAGRQVDIRVQGGRIAAVADELESCRGEEVLDAAGAVVLPGLHDHHLHLRALVAARRSMPVGPAEVAGAEGLRAALLHAATDSRGWRRAVGYHESVAGALDRWRLDALVPDAPVRVQHRSGAMWMLNTAAIDALGVEALDDPGVERDRGGRPTGRLLRMDGWLADRLPDEDPVAGLGPASRELLARGVTGVTDATPEADTAGVAALAGAVEDGRLLQRLHVMCAPDVEVPDHPLVSRGPRKVLLDDDRLPTVEEIERTVAAAHRAGVPVAVHCVTAAQIALALAAVEAAGAVPGDRIEHGSVIHPDLVARMAALGVTVVTNPGFVHARGDAYLAEVGERDIRHLYPCASLLRGGVRVAAATDAPFGPADPWTAVTAARTRRSRLGRAVVEGEAVPLATAVGLFTGHWADPARPRRIAVGEPGDFCLLQGGIVPRPGHPDTVAATVVAGRVLHRAG